MASTAKRLGLFARSSRPAHTIARCPNDVWTPAARCFSTTPSQLARPRTREARRPKARQEGSEEEELKMELMKDFFGELPSVQEANREILSDASPEDLSGYVPDKKRAKKGFWNLQDPSQAEDDEFQGDDITSKAHSELARHRDIRHYARLAVWELPLLSKLAKPFEPPATTTPLRFRYTTYMGELHPASRKVVLEFCPSDLPNLTPQQTNKLIKLVGARYNPSTKIVKMSSESFETPAQNKRYIGDTLEALLKEARDATDTFEDVPFDFRHHKPKVWHHFPKEWVLTPERQQQLAAKREETRLLEESRVERGTMVDGVVLIEKSYAAAAAPALRAPAMAEARTTRRPRSNLTGSRN